MIRLATTRGYCQDLDAQDVLRRVEWAEGSHLNHALFKVARQQKAARIFMYYWRKAQPAHRQSKAREGQDPTTTDSVQPEPQQPNLPFHHPNHHHRQHRQHRQQEPLGQQRPQEPREQQRPSQIGGWRAQRRSWRSRPREDWRAWRRGRQGRQYCNLYVSASLFIVDKKFWFSLLLWQGVDPVPLHFLLGLLLALALLVPARTLL